MVESIKRPEGVTRRLRQTSQLCSLCLALAGDRFPFKKYYKQKSDNINITSNNEAQLGEQNTHQNKEKK